MFDRGWLDSGSGCGSPIWIQLLKRFLAHLSGSISLVLNVSPCRCDIRMPNEPCDVFQRQQARSEQIRDDGSTTSVRPQPRRIETGLDGYEPDCTVDVLAKHRLALRRRKHHVGRRSLIRHNRPGITDHKPMGDLRRAVALKQPAHRRSEELSTGGPNRLCRPEDHPHNVGIRGAAPQGDNACLKIDVLPGESKRFADPPALHVAKRDGGDESSVSRSQ